MSQNGHTMGDLIVTADEDSITVTKSKGSGEHAARIRLFSQAEIESFQAQLAEIYSQEAKASLMERIIEFVRVRSKTV
ncbi:MAG: hypothetical protein R2811_00125 [Flavobacteriales bacterium]